MMSIFILSSLVIAISVNILLAPAYSNAHVYYETPQNLENLLNSRQYEKFRQILQIPSIHLVDPSQRKSGLYPMSAFNGLDYSDIMMRPGQVLNPNDRPELNGIVNMKINKWKTRNIPYYITRTLYDDEHIKHLEDEIELHNQLVAPHITFRPYQDGDKDYVIMYPGGCGCYSNLGNVGGPQVVSLAPVCLFKGFVLHSIQHVLGIGHETNRFDRDTYIGLVPENFPEIIISQYQRYDSDAFVNTGDFDYYSILGFPPEVLAFGYKAYDILKPGVNASRIGISAEMTEQDIQRVKTLYPLV